MERACTRFRCVPLGRNNRLVLNLRSFIDSVCAYGYYANPQLHIHVVCQSTSCSLRHAGGSRAAPSTRCRWIFWSLRNVLYDSLPSPSCQRPYLLQYADSLIYLPIAEATVLTFLAPIVACWACSLLIHETFTRVEQIAALVSLLGVILIAQPTSLFSMSSPSNPSASSGATDTQITKSTAATDGSYIAGDVSPAQRMTAVGVAMIGVLGAACAYTTIRWIGKRAHPLISVNYFACHCTLVSTLSLLFIPGIGFRLPSSLLDWAYLFFLGICGFVMQFLLTAGLQHEKSSRATNMIYTQMLFALAFDKLVWDSTPGVASLVGSSLILGSALYVAVQKNSVKGGGKVDDGDQERGLVDGMDAEDEEREGGRGPMRGVQEVQLRTLRV